MKRSYTGALLKPVLARAKAEPAGLECRISGHRPKTIASETPMTRPTPSFDTAVHSDYLIHWTGKDIDEQYQPNWYDDFHSFRAPEIREILAPYLDRLRNIVTFGLWMTEEPSRSFGVGTETITIPPTPQCCFTELKLSESRRHARDYGRLGIGVKRPFLFKRFGRPLAYFGFDDSSHNDKFLEACASELRDKRLLNYFKPMNRDASNLSYELYAESEWRIMYFEALEEEGFIKDPRKAENTDEHRYFNSLTKEQQSRLRYLIPLDGWFTMIIHPSVHTKNLVQWDADNGISEAIRRIKSNPHDHANRVEGLKGPVRGNWPLQVELDACRHF